TMFSVHGMQKLFGMLTTDPKPPVGSQVWVGGVIELSCGIFIALGLFTRAAAFIASGEMAVAFFQFHFHGAFAKWNWVPHVNGGELAVLYCFLFLYISTPGGGRYGIDSQFRHSRLDILQVFVDRAGRRAAGRRAQPRHPPTPAPPATL